jgi:RNA-directed DNA polymerase
MACKEVVRNKGAGGVDGMKVSELKEYLDQQRSTLEDEISNGRYIPQPIRGKEIPKGGGKFRLLGIPTAIDRMLQQAVSRVVMMHYETDFSTYSYGFRPRRNTQQAAGRSLGYINSGYQHIVEIDLKEFFDRVDHRLLLQLLYRKVKCKQTMCLIRRWLRAPLVKDGKLIKRRMGVPQGLRFVRYADDFSIYCKTKTEAKKTGNMIYLYLRDKLMLPINRDKSGIRRPINFQILGFSFVPIYRKGIKGKYQLVVAKKRWQSFKSKLKEVTKKTNPISFDQRITKLIEIQRGWINSFKHAHIKMKLEELDGWLRNRLRYCILHHWKKSERKRKNLIRLGVEAGMAYAWSRSRIACPELVFGRWMGHHPKSYFRNHHHYRPPQKERLCSTG